MTNLWKRGLSLVLALVMIIGMAPLQVFAEETDGNIVIIDDETTPSTPSEPENEPAEQATALAGSGTEADPYQIGSLEDLILFRDSVNAGETKYNAPGVYVALTANIDMASIDWSVNIGDDCSATFDGIFDGKNYTVYNLNSTETAAKADGYVCTGLFGAIYGSAVVKNLTIENVTINTGDFEGNNAVAVVGFAYSCTGSIENVKVTGNISINAKGITGTGAIVGYDYYSPSLVVKNCVVDGNDGSAIVGRSYVGGVIGYASSAINVTGNSVEGVAVTAEGGCAGGIAGILLSGGSVAGNAVTNVAVAAEHENWKNTAAAVVGSVTSGTVSVSGNILADVTANGTATSSAVGGLHADNPSEPIPAYVAAIGGNYYTSLEEAFAAAGEGDTIVLLADATPALTSQRAITKAAVIDLGGKTLTLTEDDLYFGTTTFKNGTIVVDPSVKPSTAVFWMFANQTLTFDGVKIVATGVTGTYLIGLDGNNSDLNLLNGSEILVENTTALDLDIICVNASTGNDIVVDNSKVSVTNLDGRVFFRGNYTISGTSDIDLSGITKAGFRIEAGQTLTIADTATVDIVGEPRDGGIHLTDLTATYTVAASASVNATVAAPAAAAEINGVKYATLQAAIDAAQEGDTVTVISDVSDVTVVVDKNLTITGTATLNNVGINANGADELTVSGLTFTGNSWINSGSAEKLTVSGVTANVTPSNTAYTNSRSAFISLGRSEGQALELVVENCNIVAKGGADPILGWAVITKATLTGNTFGSAEAYQTNSDSVKFMAIAEGAEFTITGNTIYSNYNGIVFGQNTTRGNAYSAVIDGNTFMGGADHIWIEVSGSNTVHASVNVKSNNTINGNAITAGDIKIHPNINTWTAYAGVDVVADENGKVIGGTLAFYAEDIIAEGYEIDANGKVSPDPAYGMVAQIGNAYFETLEEAAAAAQAGDEIVLLVDVAEDVTVPAGVIFNGNGKQVGVITAAGEITFKGHTKATNFGTQYTNTTINIIEGACLEITGTGRLVIGHGCTFNITGTITDAKNADKATIQPSLIMPGASFTGAGVTFNVTNAYITAPSSYCSSSKSASGTFDFNITNSIIETAGKLAFEEQSVNATVNFNLEDSVLTTGSHLIFGVSKGEVVIDNSNVNVGKSNQIENCSTMTIKNGSVVNGAVATSSNAINPGTVIVENATYAVSGQFSGAAVGTGTLIIKQGATVSVGSIVDKANIVIDATGMAAGNEVSFTGNLSKFAGELSVINNGFLEAKIEDGKIVLAERDLKGSGTKEEPYRIETAADLFLFAKKVNAGTYKNVHVVLTADIDLDQEDWSSIGTSSNPFTGTFDGQGHTISNIWSYESGLFGVTSTGNYVDSGVNGRATIKNLTLNGVEVYNQSASAVGGLVGQAGQNTEITGVTVTGYIGIYGYGYVGGLVGQGYVHVDDCHVIGVDSEDGDKSAIDANYWAVGGIVGHAGSEGGSSITNCSVKNVGLRSSYYGAGAIAGVGTNGPIDNVSAESVSVVAGSNPDANGLLVGCNYDKITGNETSVKDVVLTVAGEIVNNPQDMAASIGTNYYVSLQAAINAGGEVKLLKDIALTEGVVVPAGKTVTLDLNGKTISGTHSAEYAMIHVQNGATLTVNDTVGGGKITCAAGGNNTGAAIWVEGALVQNAGTIEVTGTWNLGFAVDLRPNAWGTAHTAPASFVMNGGKVVSTDTAIRVASNSSDAYQELGVNFTMNGGTIESTWDAIFVQHLYAGDLNITVENGTIIGENSAMRIYGDAGSDVDMIVKGGTFNGSIKVAEAYAGTDAIEISGGTYTDAAMQNYLADGFEVNYIWNGTSMTYGVKKQVVASVAGTEYTSLQEAIEAAYATGEPLYLKKDVKISEPITFKQGITIDGKGHTITQAASCDNQIALLYFENAGDVVIKNVTFDGIKTGAVIRTLSTDITIDNVVFQNCEHTVGQGLVRLTYGNAVIKNSKFVDNNCSMGISFNWDAAASDSINDTLVIDNCVFDGNTANKTALVYYVKGKSCTLSNNEFVENKVNCNANGAVVYLGFTENNVVTGNLFKDNVVTEATTSTRVAGAIFFGYEAEVSGNAFINNTATNASGDALGQVCTSTYYECEIDLSENYWGEAEPVYGKDYTIQHQTGEADFVLDSYYAEYDANTGAVSNLVKTKYAAQVGKRPYASLADAMAAAKAGDTVTIFADTYTQNLNVNKDITVVGETDAEGNNLVTFNGKLNITADGATVKNINVNNGSSSAGYIGAKDVLVEGCSVVGGNGFRSCYTSGTVTFKDSTITGSTYGIHFDGNAGGEIVIDNCVITGWTSFAATIKKVTMTDTTFAEGNYNYVRFYQDEVVIDGCTFNEKMGVDSAVADAKITVTSSNVAGDGSLEAVEALFEGADIVNSTITVDGEKLVRVASIGNTYYETIDEAFAEVKSGDTIVLYADVTMTQAFDVKDMVLTIEGTSTLTQEDKLNVYGESTLNISAPVSGTVNLCHGAILKDSTINGNVFVAGKVIFRGANTVNMVYDYGTLTDYYGTEAPMEWTVEKGGSLTILNKARYGLGYGDKIVITGELMEAITARAEKDNIPVSFFTHGIVAQESAGWNCNSSMTVENAYVVIGSNNSFGNKPGTYGGAYTFNFTNVLMDSSRITFYEALSTTTFNFVNSDVETGTFMTRDEDSVFNFTNTKLFSSTTFNGNDEGNYHAGKLVLSGSELTYSAPLVMEDGTIEMDANSTITAPAVTGTGKIVIDASGFAAGSKIVIAGDLTTGYTGEIEVIGAPYEITDAGLVIKTAVASVNGTLYASVLEAMAAAIKNGASEVKILTDVREKLTADTEWILNADLTITADKAVVVDFYNEGTNCDIIINSNNNNTFTIDKNVTMTLKDRLFWLGYYGNNVDVIVKGTLEGSQIWHGADTTVTSTGKLISSGEAFVLRRGATLTVDGGTIEANYFSILSGNIDAKDATITSGPIWVGNTGNYDNEGGVSLKLDNTTWTSTGNLKLASEATATLELTNGSTVTTVGAAVIDQNSGVIADSTSDCTASNKSVFVAEVGGMKYSSLQAAIDAAKAGETVTVLANIELTEGITVAADKQITLDLNGKTVSMKDSSGATAALLENFGTLTIQDSATGGKLSFNTTTPDANNGYASNTISNHGVLTVESGTIENTTVGGACYALDNYAGSTATINGGNLTAKKTAVRIFNWTDGETNKSVLNINGGNILSEDGYGINLNMGNTPTVELNITGGTITTNDEDYNLAVYVVSKGSAENVTVNVTDGTFGGNFALNGKTSETMAEGNVSISGGTFESVICYAEPAYDFITGGTYTDPKVEKFLAAGYTLNYSEGIYTPVVGKAVAVIGAEKYISLQDAFDAAQDGDTITLVADAEVLNTILVEVKNITLDLDKYTINAGYAENSTTNHIYVFDVQADGELTIEGDGVINTRGIFNRGKLTLESGTINAIDGNGGYAVRNYSGAIFTMNGGTLATTLEDDNKVDKGGYDATTLRVDDGATAVINGGVINNICDFTVAVENHGTTTINGGDISSVHTTVANYGILTIEGGKFTCNGLEGVTAHAVWAAAGTTTINGGTFDGKDNYNGFNVDASAGAVVNITGGNFLSVHSGSLYGDGTIAVSGGTFFDAVPENRCAAGFVPKANDDGTYGVKVAPTYVAAIGEKMYESLQDAVDDAQAGATITLLADVAADEVVVVKKPVNIVKGNFAITEDNVACMKYTNDEGEKVQLTCEQSPDGLVIKQAVLSSDEAGEAVAYIVGNEGNYMTLQDALNAAEATGGTVKIKADVNELVVDSIVVIPSGVTLDIESKTLTVKSLVGLKNSKLTGTPDSSSSDNKWTGGLLVTAKGNLILSETPYNNGAYDVLPVWDPAAGAYRFSLFQADATSKDAYGLFIDEAEGTLIFKFVHKATGQINKGLLIDGSSDNELKIVVHLEWMTTEGIAYQEFVYTDGLVGQVAGDDVRYTFTLEGYEKLNIVMDTLKVSARIITESGVICESVVYTAAMDKNA